ncbi:MAG: serine protein kinase RIO [Candidatus Micrarchaeaceae archaeon]
MTRRVSRRKMSRREELPFKEQLKIEEGVFDNRTIMMLGKMLTRGIVSRMDFIIGKGKEADIYLAEPGGKIYGEKVILKIFRLETSSFSNRKDYMVGDQRFDGIRSNIMQIVNAWCKKEFGNLKLAEEAGVHAPLPYSFSGNVLAMEFIGEDGKCSPTLKECGSRNPNETLKSILNDIKLLYKGGLVHGDISEYNILMKGDVPYIIDFGQAVSIGHPRSGEFLMRDIDTITGFFRKRYGIESDAQKLFESIMKR